jgi:DNA-binding MarR family transcriptional regulator
MSVALDIVSDRNLEENRDAKPNYLKSLRLIELLHHLLLDVIKDEFKRVGSSEVNSVQALLLYNIGGAEVTAGELKSRGYYLGSNVSYNLKKLVDAGYIHHERSDTDRRSVRIRLTDKGQEVCSIIDTLYGRQMQSLGEAGGVFGEDLRALNKTLARLERFWADQIRYRL